jgi:hypothetical protein
MRRPQTALRQDPLAAQAGPAFPKKAAPARPLPAAPPRVDVRHAGNSLPRAGAKARATRIAARFIVAGLTGHAHCLLPFAAARKAALIRTVLVVFSPSLFPLVGLVVFPNASKHRYRTCTHYSNYYCIQL